MRLPTHDDNYPSSPRNISKRILAKSVLTTCLLHVFLKCHLLFFPLLPQPLLLFSCYPVQIFCDHMDCSTPGSFCPQDSPGKNTGVGCHFLLQGIFSTHGSNLQSSALAGKFFTTEPPGKPLPQPLTLFFMFPTYTHIQSKPNVLGNVRSSDIRVSLLMSTPLRINWQCLAHKRHSMTIYLFHEQRNRWMNESLTFFFTNPTFSEAREEKQHWEWICLVFSGQ